MFRQETLKKFIPYILLVGLLLWFAMIGYFGMFVKKDRHSDYYSHGPGPDLYFLGLAIDTWTKWAATVALIVFNALVRVLGMAYLKTKRKTLSVGNWFCEVFRKAFAGTDFIFQVFLIGTQIDLVVISFTINLVLEMACGIPLSLSVRRKFKPEQHVPLSQMETSTVLEDSGEDEI